jgi:hypothetical protein
MNRVDRASRRGASCRALPPDGLMGEAILLGLVKAQLDALVAQPGEVSDELVNQVVSLHYA